MDMEIAIVGLTGLISMAIDALLWGLMGYVVFRILRFQDNKWIVGALITATIYFIWEDLIIGQLIGIMGLGFDNEELTEILGDDWAAFDTTDLLFSYGSVVAGFLIGMKLIKLLLKRVPPEIPGLTARALLSDKERSHLN